MKRIGFAFMITVVAVSFACRSHERREEHHQKKDCKEKCKGLKGKEHGDCNKACN